MYPADQRHNIYLRRWLWTGAFMIFLMLIVGGITRLTDSGLSMSDWNLIMGALPPLNEVQWQDTFLHYQQFPQYQQLNAGMTLEEFKGIFFWEYLHRLLGRIMGLIFLLPFLYFWYRGFLNKTMFRRVLILFGLGGLQAAMGWIMVKSGLSDVPYVSHYRLAMHLLLAFLLIELCVWYALDLRDKSPLNYRSPSFRLRTYTAFIGVVFLIQIIWGAFTAGLDAGYIYNTFPLMNGEWLPNNAWIRSGFWLDLVDNPGTVQWVHRILGTLLSGLVVLLWIKTRKHKEDSSLVLKGHILFGILAIQYITGILAVILSVPITLGVIHQAGAMVFGIAWLVYFHHINKTLASRRKLTFAD